MGKEIPKLNTTNSPRKTYKNMLTIFPIKRWLNADTNAQNIKKGGYHFKEKHSASLQKTVLL